MQKRGEQGQIQSCYSQMVVPVPRHSGLPRAGIRVTSQHFESGRLSSSVNSQQSEALMAQKAIRLTHRRWNTLQGGEKDDMRSCEPLMSIRNQMNESGCNNILTSPLQERRRHRSGQQPPSSCPHRSVQRTQPQQGTHILVRDNCFISMKPWRRC